MSIWATCASSRVAIVGGLLAAAIAAEVTATLALKAALGRPMLYPIVAGGYLTAFFLLAVILRRDVGLGLIYGIWSALGVAGTATLSSLIYDEPFTPIMGVGLALIIAGVFLIGYGSRPTPWGRSHPEHRTSAEATGS